jgi:hypothetical protein
VAGEACDAQIAAATDNVDFADDALLEQVFVWGIEDDADKLVAEDAPEGEVAFGDFEVCGADAGLADADERVAFGGRWVGVARVEGEGLREGEGAHG